MNAGSILSIVGFALVSSGAGVASAQILEVNVSNQPAFVHGNNTTAINPTDVHNLVYTATKHDCAASSAGGGTCDGSDCFMAYSTNRGQSWTTVPYPYGSLYPVPLPTPPPVGGRVCGEPNLTVDSDGAFFVVFNDLTGTSLGNRVWFSRSTNGGATWSAAVPTTVSIGHPNVKVDAVTGKLYVLGSPTTLIPTSAALTISVNRGQSWSPYLYFPGAGQKSIAVHDRILATGTEQAASTTIYCGPPTPQCVGTGTVTATGLSFQVSRDDGVTYTTYPVTNTAGVPVPAGTSDQGTPDPAPWVAADTTRSGRFAVMHLRGDDYEVYVTEDAGLTWTGPALIHAPGAAFGHIDFGPTGNLGVMWRKLNATGDMIDAYSAVSFDRGHTFSAPLRVNAATQPAGRYGAGPGDDFSGITLDDQYVYVSWPDARTGNLIGSDGILARVPLVLY